MTDSRPKVEKDKANAMAFVKAMKPLAHSSMEKEPFKNRGFSDRTIQAIVDCGIDSPERLLFIDETIIKKMPGIGKASFSEIKLYRDRFLSK